MKLAPMIVLEVLLGGAVLAQPGGYEGEGAGPRESQFVLRPTIAAPVGASGVVQFGGSAGGVTTLLVKTQQLGPGLYWLSVYPQSGGEALQLGPIGVADPDSQPSREAGNSFKQRSSTYQAERLTTQTTVTLPKGWGPASIGLVVVSDLVGNRLLEGHPVAP